MNYNSNNNNSVFKCGRIFCCFSFGNKGKEIGVYLAGILVSNVLLQMKFILLMLCVVCFRLVDIY